MKKTNKKAQYSFLSKIYRRLILEKMHLIQYGCIRFVCSDNSYYFGDVNHNSKVSLVIHKPETFKLIVLKGHIGLAEAFCNGACSTTQLTELLFIFARNFTVVDKAETGISWLFNKTQYLYYKYFEKNSLSGSKKNIHAHYDLGNNLFTCFLDQNMQYSSAIYQDGITSLDDAQLKKLQTICQRLNLNKHDHVLEIGSGWGGLAIFIATNIGCKVTTITISEEQFQYAKEKINRAQLGHLVEIKLCDYRDVSGTYDKIVSIEMIEAVGEKYYQCYFDAIIKHLKPGGLFLMQAILISDHEYDKAKKSVDFIKKYIFPGSNIPSLNRLNRAANIAHLRLDSYFDMTKDYAKTLCEWQVRFNNNKASLDSLGYDEFFQNLWNFYFSYCQAGFLVEHIRSAQIVFKSIKK